MYKFVRFIFLVYFYIFNRVTVQGYENIPDSAGIIICPNHIHWLDPMLIGVHIKRKINYMAKAELFKNKLLSFLLKCINAFPVKRGTGDITAIKTSLRLIKNGQALGIFPEGTRSRDGKLMHAEPGAVLLSIKAKAPIIPVRISGSYRIFGRLNISIGKPIAFAEYNNKKLTAQEINSLSQKIIEGIINLA